MKKTYIYKKPKVKMAAFLIDYDYSAINEYSGIYGTSHLMEHLICHSLDSLLPEFTKNGINHNAFTSNNHVVFFIEGLDENIQKFKSIFIDKITNSFDISEEQFENEKNIVLQEYDDCFARVESNAMINAFRKYYDYYAPIGNREDIKNFTLSQAKDIYNIVFHHPDKIIDISQTKLNDDIINNVEFFNQQVKTRKLKFKKYKNSLEHISSERYVCMHLCKQPVGKKDFAALDVGIDMLCSGLDSILYKIIREENGLTYGINGTVMEMSNSYALAFIMNNTSDIDKAQKAMQLYEKVFTNLDTYLTQERYDAVVSQDMISLKKSKILIWENADDIFKCMNITEKDLKSLTLDKVKEVTKKYLGNAYSFVSKNNEEIKLKKDYRQLYDKMVKSEWFQDAYNNKSLGETIEINE